MKNKLKQFVEKRGMTAYKLSKQTGLPLNTVYRLVNNPSQVPSGEVMDAILNQYSDASVGELLEHCREAEAVAWSRHSSIDIAKLSSLPLADRKRLPKCAACYLVLEGEQVVYIGQAKNLLVRWQSHNKLKCFQERKDEIKVT